jgi:stage III sporulation protein AA
LISKDKIEPCISRRGRIENEVFRYLCAELRTVLDRVDARKLENAEEIRLRANKPLMLFESGSDWFVNRQGEITGDVDSSYIVSQDDIFKTISLMSESSIYAYQDDIKNGFITLKGGHRVGIAGKGVLDAGRLKNLKDFSSLNIRLAREVRGCSRKILKYIINDYGILCSTLIVSPPQCGKTTMLRDLAQQLSDGIPDIGFKGIKVGIVDERSEIAACYKGVSSYLDQ